MAARREDLTAPDSRDPGARTRPRERPAGRRVVRVPALAGAGSRRDTGQASSMNSHTPGASAGRTAVPGAASTRRLTALDRLERAAVADPAIRVLQRGIPRAPRAGCLICCAAGRSGTLCIPYWCRYRSDAGSRPPCWTSPPGRSARARPSPPDRPGSPRQPWPAGSGRTLLPNRPGSVRPARPPRGDGTAELPSPPEQPVEAVTSGTAAPKAVRSPYRTSVSSPVCAPRAGRTRRIAAAGPDGHPVRHLRRQGRRLNHASAG